MTVSNYYRRNLPHWHPSGVSIFLTWRLDGSLPLDVIESLGLCDGGCAIEPGKSFKRIDWWNTKNYSRELIRFSIAPAADRSGLVIRGLPSLFKTPSSIGTQ